MSHIEAGVSERAERLQRITIGIDALRATGSVCQHVGVRDNGYRIDCYSTGVQATCSFADVCRFQYRLRSGEAERDCGCIHFRGSNQNTTNGVAVCLSNKWPGYTSNQPQPLPTQPELIEYSRVLLNDYAKNFKNLCATLGYEAAILAIRQALVQGQPGRAGPGYPSVHVDHGDVCISNVHSRTPEVRLKLNNWLKQLLPDPSKPAQLSMF